jgi:hypothetical protein
MVAVRRSAVRTQRPAPAGLYALCILLLVAATLLGCDARHPDPTAPTAAATLPAIEVGLCAHIPLDEVVAVLGQPLTTAPEQTGALSCSLRIGAPPDVFVLRISAEDNFDDLDAVMAVFGGGHELDTVDFPSYLVPDRRALWVQADHRLFRYELIGGSFRERDTRVALGAVAEVTILHVLD